MARQRYRFGDARLDDSGVEVIDLSKLLTSTPDKEQELIDLNRRVKIEHPHEWLYCPSDGEEPRFIYDKSGWHEPPTYKNLAGQRVKPTQIISLLTQNPTDGTRPASSFFWWKQPDEDHYVTWARAGMAEFLAETRENYYFVDEHSGHRLRFKCPDPTRGGTLYGSHPTDIGSIAIYINPANGQAFWICPKCTQLNSKKYGGDGRAVKHPISRELRDELARDGVLPAKIYKHKDRASEKDKLIDVIRRNPGSSFYELDQLMGWGGNGETSKRVINRHLMNVVDLKKGRKGHKGYKVYIKK